MTLFRKYVSHLVLPLERAPNFDRIASQNTRDSEMADKIAPSKDLSRVQRLLAPLPRLTVDLPDPVFAQYERQFHCFAKLPLELRNNIWKRACFESRIIKVAANEGTAEFETVQRSVEGQRRHPAILHASREARAEGGRVYQRFQDLIRNLDTTDNGVHDQYNTVCINCAVDHLMLVNNTDMFYTRRPPYHTLNRDTEVIRNFRYLELDHFDNSCFDQREIKYTPIFKEIKKLDEIVIHAAYWLDVAVGQQERLRGHMECNAFKGAVISAHYPKLAKLFPHHIPRISVKRPMDDEIDLHPWSTDVERYRILYEPAWCPPGLTREDFAHAEEAQNLDYWGRDIIG